MATCLGSFSHTYTNNTLPPPSPHITHCHTITQAVTHTQVTHMTHVTNIPHYDILPQKMSHTV